ncbi:MULTISPECIES: thermostable hemolysin [unclassified Pseudomonas]|uniref:thermostable hemolysin n=1 Tax=Pseudomonas TaxID=286 RepID=UPI0024B32D62|nr:MULTISPECIES: thermostable hemolysin [unclassified Pseudomonas]
MRIQVAKRNTQLWKSAVEFVKRRYMKSFNAIIEPSPEYFLIVLQNNDSIQSCAGFSFAKSGPLLSECYLDSTCEETLSSITNTRIERDCIVEVGSTASINPVAGQTLFNMLSVVTWCMGARYLLCTCTPHLIKVMGNCNVRVNKICDADPQRMTSQAEVEWGSYYDQTPITGYIKLGEMERHYHETVLKTVFRLDVQSEQAA